MPRVKRTRSSSGSPKAAVRTLEALARALGSIPAFNGARRQFTLSDVARLVGWHHLRANRGSLIPRAESFSQSCSHTKPELQPQLI